MLWNKKEETKLTHKDRVLRHLIDRGSITQVEAVKDYGNYRLSEYIRQLREDGYLIDSVWKSGKNRYGEKTHFVRYTLER